MAEVHETAYPRLKHNPSHRDLAETYSPSEGELKLADSLARSEVAKLGFLLLLKTFQRLGYFVHLDEVPVAIVEHVARCLGYLFVPLRLLDYDRSGTRTSHVAAIRAKEGVKPFSTGGQQVMAQAMREAAQTREDLRDLINPAVEELARARIELPAFSTLKRAAYRARAEVNEGYYKRVFDALTQEDHAVLEALFTEPLAGETISAWRRVKRDPGKATLTNLAALLEHHAWLVSLKPSLDLTVLLPDAKLRQFAAEGDSLDLARMRRVEPVKRLTLAAALLHTKAAQVLDDLGDLYCKRLHAIQRKGKEALEAYHREHQSRTDTLIRALRDVLTAYQSEGDETARFKAIRGVVGHRADDLAAQCEAHEAYADNNYLPLLWRCYASHRATLFRLARALPLRATTQDGSFMAALAFLLDNEKSRADWLSLEGRALDLSWVGDKWWPLVTGEKKRLPTPERINRKHFEICVFYQLLQELKSGDVCIEGSLEYADYRPQLIGDATYAEMITAFGVEVGLPTDPAAFVEHMRAWLHKLATQTDLSFPANDALSLENGRPVLKKRRREVAQRRIRRLQQRLRERFTPTPILDILADTENLLAWTQFFKPLTGYEAKIEHARARYLTTTFCYGCNVGPSQTARALPGADRKQIAWVNQRHIQDEDLERAKTLLINAYNRFAIPKLWGTGKTASADGTKWDVYEKNLLAEYHIRYGGYGGIGYYHVSDTYIALFSRFIPCGVYEAVHILDGLLENDSDIQPDTVHSDTHGQSVPLFGLAHLLGIELMPRIRHWKDLVFVRPDKGIRYEHIDALFTDTPDWDLIRRYLPDLLRIVLSIKAGKISASTILKRLSAYSRKNHVYQAFRELGRVVRTGFLLRYLADEELRTTIQAAMNKSEQFNAFLKWLAFGGEELRTNDRELQQKIIRYNHLIANCVIFYNVMLLTRAVKELREQGEEVPEDLLAGLNPYMTEHINRLGEYRLDLSRVPPEPDYDYPFAPTHATDTPLHESR